MILPPQTTCTECRLLWKHAYTQLVSKTPSCAPLKAGTRRNLFSTSSRKLQLAATRAPARIPKDRLGRSTSTPSSALPERLLIFNAGLPKTFGVAATKITTVMVFGGTCMLAIPATYYAESSPNWARVAMLFVIGVAPLTIYTYLSGPFVNSIFLRLPKYARESKDMCIRYAKQLPPDAQLEVVTLRFIGWPKTTGVRMSELRLVDKAKKPWWDFRLPNMYRVNPVVQSKNSEQSSRWRERLFRNRQREFYYDESKDAGNDAKIQGVWEIVLQQIRRNSGLPKTSSAP